MRVRDKDVHVVPDGMLSVNRHPYELRKAGEALVALCGFTPKYYPPETVILRQGDGETRTFLIESGWGMVHRDLSTGARQIVELPISGDFVGHFTHHAIRHESFSSVTDLRVWEGSANAFHAALTDTSSVGDFVYSAIARQRSLLGERLADIGQRGAAVRATHFLLELGLRLEYIGAAQCDNYYCPLTQSVLADTLGLTAIHLNRTLRETREAGLFQFRRGHVEFLDYEAAVSFAQFDGSYLQG